MHHGAAGERRPVEQPAAARVAVAFATVLFIKRPAGPPFLCGRCRPFVVGAAETREVHRDRPQVRGRQVAGAVRDHRVHRPETARTRAVAFAEVACDLLRRPGAEPLLRRGEIEGRRQAIHAIEALRQFMPGCETAKLRNFGMTIGIRDTRKIDALYNLTAADVREQGRFADSIGIFPEFIDGYGLLILPTTGRYFHVPYRALVPRGVGNLIVAGRCIGGDRVSHAAVRNMMCCAVSGQGAGVAAAVSLQRDQAFAAVDVAAVQAELRRQGARID
ncbi:MAG: FAD-dependent oxidoreductase [Gammaproteobacteria bacterium]|nr:FAD-dependent oxidoreductase [Gammaproteobacteria bacterium]